MSLPLNQAVDAYLESFRALQRSENTIRSYGCILSLFNRFLCTKYNYQVYVDEVTFEDMNDYLNHLCFEKNYAPSSRYGFLAVTKLFFDYSNKTGICTGNPAKQVVVLPIVKTFFQEG